MAGKQDIKELASQDANDIWTSAAHADIPDDAWEYQIRKSLNDAAYNGLQYVPYCSLMPVPAKCEEPKFLWKKKGAQSGH